MYEENERDKAAETCDGNCSTDERTQRGNDLLQTVDSWVCRTAKDVDEAECNRCLASVCVGLSTARFNVPLDTV